MSAPTHSSQELLESWGDVVPTYDADLCDSPSSLYGLLTRYQRPATTIHDRADGRFLPVYQTEFDLAVIRSMGRTLAVAAPGLVGGLRNMCNYTIGEGFSFTATREPTADLTEKQCEPLLKLIQNEIKKFLDDNNFLSGFDREIHDTSIIDGESFLYLQAAEDRVRVTRCEPDHVREPASTRELEDWIQGAYGIECDSFVSSWSFGVHTRADALDDPLGYHVVADESGVNWEYVPADRMVHIKRNVTRNAKRGFSDLYPIEADSARGEKLRRNMAEGAAIQSAIAFVRQHVAGTTRTGVETMLGENKSATQYPTTFNGMSRPKNIVQYRPGTVVDLSAGLEYKPGPLGSERANDFLLVASYVQRMQAVRWSMPEYMFSGDASNANYASTMEATAPFVKSCEAEQRFYSRHFVALIWKALKLRWELGAFDRFDYEWERIEQSIKLTADCPEVATRDELANVQRQEILIRLGILSRKTAATQNGLDYEAEVASGAAVEGQGGQQDTSGTSAKKATDGNTAGQETAKLSAEQLGESVLLECGGKGSRRPGPCPKHKFQSRQSEDSHGGRQEKNQSQSNGKERTSDSSQRAKQKPPSKSTKSKTPSASHEPSSGTVAKSSNTDATHSESHVKGRENLEEPKPAKKKKKEKDHKGKAPKKAEPPHGEQAEKEVRNSNPNTGDRQEYAFATQEATATGIGGKSVEDNAPADIRIETVRDGKKALIFGEHKAMLDRKTDDITISKAAFERKARVTADTGHPFFTIVTDQRDEYKDGIHKPETHNKYYIKFGAYSGSLADMHEFDSLESLDFLHKPVEEWPPKAQPHPKWLEAVKNAKANSELGKLKPGKASHYQLKANEIERTEQSVKA